MFAGRNQDNLVVESPRYVYRDWIVGNQCNKHEDDNTGDGDEDSEGEDTSTGDGQGGDDWAAGDGDSSSPAGECNKDDDAEYASGKKIIDPNYHFFNGDTDIPSFLNSQFSSKSSGIG